jgi:protocatechuate 3,4-dioxygenase beta subunit
MKSFIIACCYSLVASAFAVQTIFGKDTPGLSLQGKVLQEGGTQPIRKANVQLNGADGQSPVQFSAITDAEGQFRIDEIKPGRYVVVIDHPGFVQSGGTRRAASILLQAGQSTTELIFRMQPAAVIAGKIVDSDGDPMGNVGVSAMRVGVVGRGVNPHDSGNGSTNDLGEFRISGLRAGRYLVTASPPEGPRAPHQEERAKAKEHVIYTTTYYPGTLDKDQAVPVEVHPGDEVPVNFGVLSSRAYRVAGIVAGVPKGGMAEIMLTSKDHGGLEIPQQLGEGGRFEFPNVLPGSYVVRLVVFSGFLGGGQPSVQLLRVSQPIEVVSANVENLRLQPDPGGNVRGRFRMDTGQKFDWTQLNVILLPVDEYGSESVVTESIVIGSGGSPAVSSVSNDGTFELKNVPAGNYQLLVEAKSNNLRDYFTKSVNLEGRDVADSGFAVRPSTQLDVVVSANGGTIEGTVVDSKGQPVAHATVVDVPSTDHRARPDFYQQDATDERGHFSLRGLNPGTYTVLAFEELQEDFRQPEFLKSYGGRGEKVELGEGSRTAVILKVIPVDVDAP